MILERVLGELLHGREAIERRYRDRWWPAGNRPGAAGPIPSSDAGRNAAAVLGIQLERFEDREPFSFEKLENPRRLAAGPLADEKHGQSIVVGVVGRVRLGYDVRQPGVLPRVFAQRIGGRFPVRPLENLAEAGVISGTGSPAATAISEMAVA